MRCDGITTGHNMDFKLELRRARRAYVVKVMKILDNVDKTLNESS